MTDSKPNTNDSAPAPPGTPRPPIDAASQRGPIRNTLESFGMAVLMAVLLKYFVLEAYVIPTPSMQPTMMGSPSAGETDRILVDKSYYLFHEPQRWDIAVFRYPVRQVQSYVKRIVGVGGDRLWIAAGNIYQASADGKSHTILRKPERIQRTLWREIYPMRRKLELYESRDGVDVDVAPTDNDVFGRGAFFRSVRGKWKIGSEGQFRGTPDSSNHLKIALRSEQARNNYADGYDLAVAKSTREERKRSASNTQADGLTDVERGDRSGLSLQAVSDLRIGFDLTPTQSPDKLRIAIDVASKELTYEVVIEKGQATLNAIISKPGPGQTLSSEPIAFDIPANESTPVQFARLDDRLYLWHNGDLVSQLDVDSIAIKERLAVGTVAPSIELIGKGTCSFGNLTIERDLHYTRSRLAPEEIIDVPDGHFFMMGDNTLGSADGRDWTALRIGVDAQGNIVDPETHKTARVLWGNKRTKPFVGAGKPHDDDNPVPLYNNQVVFVDHLGETHSLTAKVDQNSWGETDYIQFTGNTPWIAKEQKHSFVPRHHIEGRPIARFLRSLSSFKTVSWIR
jgi:signal peptidase I